MFGPGFTLQCHVGGVGNNPEDWSTAVPHTMGGDFDAKGFVDLGLWCIHKTPGEPNCVAGDCPATILSLRARASVWHAIGEYDDVLIFGF